ncbi:MAG: hypothetical protein NVS2B9_01020 [Myxococcales bacterium]
MNTGLKWTFACALAAAGCASTEAERKARAEAAPGTMLVCEMERPTGSMIPQRVCRTQELAEKEHRAIDEITHTVGVQRAQ